MKRALVCGAGGFIGGHLVKKLKREGYWVRGVDIKEHEYVPTVADEFLLLDLREKENCKTVLSLSEGQFDEVYQLAADMGGMGFISIAECEIMHNNALINIHMTHTAAELGIPRYFFSSSVCVYRDMKPGEPEMTEAEAIPACPDNEYGWEKLYSERVAMAYSRNRNMKVRIARFQNCYGPEGTWMGGREKAPAAICRKVIQSKMSGDHKIEIWGDGEQTRSFTYIDDCIHGIHLIMNSYVSEPLNLGSDQMVTINQMVDIVEKIAGIRLKRNYNLNAPKGVRGRNSNNDKIKSLLGWAPSIRLESGLEKTYTFIYDEIKSGKKSKTY